MLYLHQHLSCKDKPIFREWTIHPINYLLCVMAIKLSSSESYTALHYTEV